ncbi:MAG: hypothetical protein AB7N91_20640 [Candidatus Tectimicrobiota bacterium]
MGGPRAVPGSRVYAEAPVRYVPEDYPVVAAERGTGMQVSYSRRPRVPRASLLPLMVRMLGSGADGLWFLMYHKGPLSQRTLRSIEMARVARSNRMMTRRRCARLASPGPALLP